jgi:hypothetical protein
MAAGTARAHHGRDRAINLADPWCRRKAPFSRRTSIAAFRGTPIKVFGRDIKSAIQGVRFSEGFTPTTLYTKAGDLIFTTRPPV